MDSNQPQPGADVVAPAAQPAIDTRAAGGGLRLSGRMNGALLLALIAILLVAWLKLDTRYRIKNVELQLSKQLAEFDERSREGTSAARQTQEASREALAKLAVVENKLAESQNQQVALEALYQELSRSRDEWVLAEVEQILLTASEQLQLAGNVKAALIALQTADARLQRFDRPQLIPLRKAVARDIERLQALPVVDKTGISLRLDGLVRTVDELPLVVSNLPGRDKTRAPSSAENTWQRLGREAWADFKELVQVRNLQTTEAPLLAPSQEYFLRENLKLRLLSARLELLQHDETGFKSDLRAAEDWLKRYYDLRSPAASSALATVQKLSGTRVTVELPDISGSLDAVRNYKLARERTSR